MKTTHVMFGGLLFGFLFSGFSCKPPKDPVRQVASITGTAHSQKLDDITIESLFTGVAQLVKSRGFHDLEDQSYIKDGCISADNFWLAPSFSCKVRIDRESVNVEFHEWKIRSGNFPATEEQRALVRSLANDVETYLRPRLPATYEIHVSINKHDAETK